MHDTKTGKASSLFYAEIAISHEGPRMQLNPGKKTFPTLLLVFFVTSVLLDYQEVLLSIKTTPGGACYQKIPTCNLLAAINII